MTLDHPEPKAGPAIRQEDWRSLRRILGVAIATAIAIAFVGLQSSFAQDGHVSDCFSGALAGDPVHCTVIQDAHNQGEITVEAIYSTANGRLLYIYIAEDQSDAERVFDDLAAKAADRIEEFGVDSHCSTQFAPGICQPGTFPDKLGFTLMPLSVRYQDVRLRFGGAGARRSQVGWASFVQEWPSVPDGAAQPIAQVPIEFDVSDVDTEKIPPIDCGDTFAFHTLACQMREIFPELEIARWKDGSEIYVEVKAAPGEEERAVADARAAIVEFFQLDHDQAQLVIVIPVKHSYEDLWRYRVILDRFAVSAGNSVGILRSRISDTTASVAATARIAFPAPGIEQVLRNENGVFDQSRNRATLWLWTADFDGTTGEPGPLLPQLGIPTDAVGVVIEAEFTPFPGMVAETAGARDPDASPTLTPSAPPRLSDVASEPPSTQRSQVPDGNLPGGTTNPVFIAAALVVAISATAAVAFLRRRSRGRDNGE